MNNLLWFSRWYSNQVSGGTGKTINVNISSEKNSAWKVQIDLKYTDARKLSIKSQYFAKSEFNWYRFKIKNKTFIAEGDFTKLDFLIGKFRELVAVSKHKNSITYKEDYFLSKEIKEFLFDDEEHIRIFLHYTAQQETADKILKDGLYYTYAFDKTATPIKNNNVDLNYIHYVRKQFGDYIVVIGFSKKLYDKYIELINELNANILRVEEILCEKPILKNDDDEFVYILSNKFIKGYCNYKTGKIIPNPEYNPNFDSEIFVQNIKMFIN